MNTLESIQTIRFGVEIETVGLDREAIATAIVRAMGDGWRLGHEGGYYNKWLAIAPDGRIWTCMSDASLSNYGQSAEIVTPILTYADMDTLQNVIRAARAAGAKVDTSCGVHVHVDGSPFDSNGLIRLAKLVYQQEELLIAALGVRGSRLDRYTKRVDAEFIKRLEQEKPRDRNALAASWYGNVSEARHAASQHYHQSRYHGLNMHSVWFRGTVEFRYFEGTLHAGEVKSYVQLCLALAAKAMTAKSAVARKREFNPASAKYDVRVFLLRLGFIGDAFKSARKHLLKRLEGSAAWKNGRPTPTVASEPAPASA